MAANFARFFARSTEGSGIEQKAGKHEASPRSDRTEDSGTKQKAGKHEASPRSDRSDKSDENAPAARRRTRSEPYVQDSTTDTTAVTTMGVDTTRIPSPGEARKEEDNPHITFKKEDMEKTVPTSAPTQLANEDLKRLLRELTRTEEDKEYRSVEKMITLDVKKMDPLSDTGVLIHDDTQDAQTAAKRYKEMSEQYERKGPLDMSSLGAGGTVRAGPSPSPSTAKSDGEREVDATRHPSKAKKRDAARRAPRRD